MYLSRALLKPDAGSALWQRLGGEYRLHQIAWSFFADQPERQRDFLYRLEVGRTGPRFFFLSKRRPVDPNGVFDVSVKDFAPCLAAGDTLRFSLRANPIVTRGRKRCDVVMDTKYRMGWKHLDPRSRPLEADLIQEAGSTWLESRATRHGFSLVPETVRADGYQVRHLQKDGHDMTVATCELQGMLRVTDPAVFLQSLQAGFGPAKGFGCGLMLIARAMA